MSFLGYIQIIRQCNQSCLFCSSPVNNKIYKFNNIISDIDKYIKERCDGVILTGGEPTLHPQLSNILDYSKKQKIDSRIITNGQITSSLDFLYNLKKAGLNSMHVSIHSAIGRIQNYLSQNNSSFKNIIKTLVNARQLNIKVRINIVINSMNARFLDKNIKYFTYKFPEIDHYIINNIDPINNSVSNNRFLVPRFSDFKDSLENAMGYLIKIKKTFRVEMVPLCYMGDFAEFSTETRKIVKNEERILNFLDYRNKPYLVQGTSCFQYEYGRVCSECSLKKICAGIHGLGEYFLSKELIPQKRNPQKIINNIIR